MDEYGKLSVIKNLETGEILFLCSTCAKTIAIVKEEIKPGDKFKCYFCGITNYAK